MTSEQLWDPHPQGVGSEARLPGFIAWLWPPLTGKLCAGYFISFSLLSCKMETHHMLYLFKDDLARTMYQGYYKLFMNINI